MLQLLKQESRKRKRKQIKRVYLLKKSEVVLLLVNNVDNIFDNNVDIIYV